MRIASIDMGSNTILLLIAEIKDGKLIPLLNLYQAPRMSSDLTKSGIVTQETLNRVVNVLTEYKNTISKYDCEITLLKATAGLRNAQNKDEVLKTIKKRTGFEVEIIPGEKEAELTYLGAIGNFRSKSNYCVIDIGGASTEVIYGDSKSIEFKLSFPFGAVLLRDKFIKKYPAGDKELTNLQTYLGKEFKILRNKFRSTNLLPIAVAGTPTSLSALNLGLANYEETLIEGSVLKTTEIEKLIAYMQQLTPEELLKLHTNIVKGREDILIVGSVILLSFLRTLGLSQVFVSGRGLRYGIIIDYLNKLK